MRRALVAVAVVALACGRKNPPVAPELVQPHAPVSLAATSAADGVRLSWLRPLRYSGGQQMNDLARFVIDRAPGDGPPEDFRRIGELVLDDRFRFRKDRHLEWIDHDAVAGTAYLYRVTSITLDGSRSRPAGPVSIRFQPKADGKPEGKPETKPPSTPQDHP